MATAREPQQIAKRALILGAVSFRASLEVTTHPRVMELSQRLLPWLVEIGCHDEIDPTELELLQTPLGRLGESLKLDARWAGEAAMFFCWMLNLVPAPGETQLADPSVLPKILCILRPEAGEILRSASLRNLSEIEEACRHLVLVLSMLRESRVEGEARNIIRGVHLRELSEAGSPATEESINRAMESVRQMTPDERRLMAGAYLVRKHAALWFLNGAANYFA